MSLSVILPYQSTGKRVKRRTVGQSHFPGRAEGSSCETEDKPGKTIKYV